MAKIIFPGSAGGSAGSTSGANIGGGTQVWVSGIPMGDFLSPHTASASPVDARAATGDLDPNASGTLDIGSTTVGWGSGWFNGVVLTAESNGTKWALRVDGTGGLSTVEL